MVSHSQYRRYLGYAYHWLSINDNRRPNSSLVARGFRCKDAMVNLLRMVNCCKLTELQLNDEVLGYERSIDNRVE